jgi:hypothetical protein
MTTTINVSSITRSIETLLNNDQNFEQTTICRGEPVNRDPGNCPWIGIYRKEHRYDPRTLGAGSGHRQFTGDIILIAQETDDTGADCEDLLDALVKNIFDAIYTDPTILSEVDMTNEAKVSYSYDSFDEEEDEYNHYFQTAFIQLTLEASTS